MIDRVERDRAAAIASGCPVSHLSQPVHPKTEVYGRLAGEVFAHISLDVIAKDMRQFKGRTVRSLGSALSSALFGQAFAARRRANTQRLDELFNTRRAERDGWDEAPAISLERVTSGVNAAIFAEELTLTTLRHRVRSRGETVTSAGIRDSQRIPFALALLSLEGLNPVLNGITEQLPASEFADENGKVIADAACRLDERKGLVITGDFEKYTARIEASEPHIGCPVTLLNGFIRRFHGIAVDATIHNGIIPVVD